MHAKILTIFPEIFSGFLSSSLIHKAQEKGLIDLEVINIREFADPPHRQVDDTPYGGGAGMVMKPEPLVRAIEITKKKLPNAKVILMTPTGKRFDQRMAHRLSKEKELIIVCGRYEGVDQRVIDLSIDEEISIGDFVSMGGELPAMLIIESTTRLLPGVLGNTDSLVHESFSLESGHLEYPQYTKPSEFRNMKIPEILLSGDHGKIDKWRKEQAILRTKRERPDLVPSTSAGPFDLSVALLHEDMRNKQGSNVTTSLTLIDIHDLARSCRSYGLNRLFIAHPSPALRDLAHTVLNHWQEGYGATYNPDRKEALSTLQIVRTLDESIASIQDRTGKTPKIIASSAAEGGNRISFFDLRKQILLNESPFLLLLGTGWGMNESLLGKADYFLAPIKGPSDFNHLSVRSACAIMLDRLLGA